MKIPSKKKKRTGAPPKGYDSWFEYDLHHKQLKGCKCHSETIKYIQYKTYHPDFIYHMGKDTIYIEAKGRFRDRQEARKYVTTQRLPCQELGEEEMEQSLLTENGQTSKGSGTLLNTMSLLHGVLNSIALITLPILLACFLFGGEESLYSHVLAYYEAQTIYYNDLALVCATR